MRASVCLFSGFFAVGLLDLLLLSLGPAAGAEGTGQLSRFVPLVLIAVPAAAGLAGIALAALRSLLARRVRKAFVEGVIDTLAASPLLACIPGMLDGPAISGSPWRWPLGLAAAAATVAGVALLRRTAGGFRARIATGRHLPAVATLAVATLLVVGIGGAMLAADSVPAKLYPPFHRAVSLGAAGLAAAGLFVSTAKAERWPGVRLLAAALAVLLLASWACGARLSRGAVLGRQLIAEHGLFLGPFTEALYSASRIATFDVRRASSPSMRDGIARRAGVSAALFPPGAPRRDVLLITVDALRRDAFVGTSPMARRALFFERAYSPSNYTPYSMPGMVLGYQPAPGSRPPDSHTVAEAFNRAGYLTELHFTAHQYASLERTPLWPLASRGFMFQRYRPEYLDAATVLERVRRTLSEGSRPRFVWAHLSDVHSPFLLARTKGGAGADCPATYAGQVECLNRVLESWFEREVASRPDLVYALSSDHGESLGERGVWYHGSSLFEEQVAVPLLLGGPGVEPGSHPEPVSNAQMAATLLHLAGARLPPEAHLLPLSPRDPPDERGVLLVCRRERCGLVRGRYKLVASPREGSLALYDLEGDPGETVNLVARESQLAARMLAVLPGLGCPFDLSPLMAVTR